MVQFLILAGLAPTDTLNTSQNYLQSKMRCFQQISGVSDALKPVETGNIINCFRVFLKNADLVTQNLANICENHGTPLAGSRAHN